MSSTSALAGSTGTDTAHPAFEHLRSEEIASLGIVFEEYRHRKTGAVHYHLNSDSDENVFTVALRTVPQDSTGVAHILEHTALCGSEKYPVRDPFFLMIRRSLNTFMNAMTSSDWTAYPFASVNRKDFQNLLQIYLDAVFFSRLDPLDFAQEGHRVEFSETGNPDSDLEFKGVVFNEMKGAMSSINSLLWQKISEHLFPTTTYHYNSGGEPANIPDLSYDHLKAFYQTHYHPSNAIFMTFGNISAAEHHAQIETLALSRFDKLDVNISVPNEQRYTEPRRALETYCIGEDEDTTNKTHIVMGWLLGESTDLEQLLEASLLSSVLLDNSAAPLRHALETTDLGSSPSPLCGLEESMHELVFVCGLEGADKDGTADVEALIIATLEKIATDGVPKADIEAMLHQLELHQREIGGDGGYPYGLQLVMATLGVATHRGDPMGVLDMDPAIAELRRKIEDPDYIKSLVQTLLLKNTHRVTLTVVPDPTMAARQAAAEQARLAAIKQGLDKEAAQEIIDRAKALQARQEMEEDESILPKVTLADVADERPALEFSVTEGALPVTSYARGTNGIAYQQIVADLPDFSAEDMTALRFYTSMMTEAGIGDSSYLEAQRRQAAVCGGLTAYTTIRAMPDSEQNISGQLVLSSRGLTRNHRDMTALLRETFEQVRFDELPRLRELVSQARAGSESRITGNGHVLAMNAACAGMSQAARLAHVSGGLAGVASIKALDKQLEDAGTLSALAEQLAGIHQTMLTAPRQMLLIAEQQQLAAMHSDIEAVWADYSAAAAPALYHPQPLRESTQQFWVCNTQVNFCARAYPTVAADHDDAPALAVLGGFLRNGFLHRAIREQGGAYGGGAGQDSGIGAFRFFSYRDPRMAETLTDFDRSVEWILGATLEYEQLEQAILGVISGLDKPGSPAGEAKQDFHDRRFGRTPEQLAAFRRKVLAVTLADLKRVAQTWLTPDNASTAVVSNASGRGAGEQLIETLNMDILQC